MMRGNTDSGEQCATCASEARSHSDSSRSRGLSPALLQELRVQYVGMHATGSADAHRAGAIPALHILFDHFPVESALLRAP